MAERAIKPVSGKGAVGMGAPSPLPSTQRFRFITKSRTLLKLLVHDTQEEGSEEEKINRYIKAVNSCMVFVCSMLGLGRVTGLAFAPFPDTFAFD